ncbi:hypothetical protein EDB92DRAFT_1816151 [Lactarius akahatsu]|uniref:Fungal-type protein kinase domain-containing protein n=1 Tax=Lactarius akahatsu TaxID=416441 RepID=A0AAD4LH07_9AGAM|nr:hypothetical protein EDB92DRAFT_1816151 [Lactarius akahatsu]
MKEKVFNELKSATFTVDLTTQGGPLQANPDDVQMVVGHLQHNYGLTCETLIDDSQSSTEAAPRLPSRGFRGEEKKSYEPLTHFLNIIVDVANTHFTHTRYLKDLRFTPYDVGMGNILDSGKPLKPDVLGLLHPYTPDGPKIVWDDVAVIVEAKDRPVDMVKQLATRSFSITIAFDHRALTMRFLCFHRSGVSASELLKLKEEDGFRSVVEHMVGILSIRDEAGFGLDSTRVDKMFRLNGRYYAIVRTIQNRDSIRGHATAVYSLESQTTDIPNIPVWQSRELTLVDRVPQLPNKMVYKLSYQTDGRPSEGTLLSRFFGQFGIVDIIGHHVCTAEESFGSTAHHLLNAQFWKVVDDSPVRSPEIKQLHCTAMSLEGLPLLDTSDEAAGIPTPAGLVETILHSMIGHYNLYLGGVLHRDVSSGNILRLREPINRSPGLSMGLLGLHDQDVNLCQGFLVDGDHAIERRKGAIAPSLERSGTLPFMSTRLLDEWRLNNLVLHTAIDDLESFLWVLVWSLVCVFKKFANITNQNSRIHDLGRSLSSRSFLEIQSREASAKKWKDKVFRDLIRDWLRISETSRTVVNDLQETLIELVNDGDTGDAQTRIFAELDKHCGMAYKEFIQSGYEHLQTIRAFSNWRDVVDFDGELLNK